jgi:maltooligosyltrehalose synthase
MLSGYRLLSVYRTYINAYAGFLDERDKATIIAAVSEAERRNPTISSEIFGFVHQILLLQYPSK